MFHSLFFLDERSIRLFAQLICWSFCLINIGAFCVVFFFFVLRKVWNYVLVSAFFWCIITAHGIMNNNDAQKESEKNAECSNEYCLLSVLLYAARVCGAKCTCRYLIQLYIICTFDTLKLCVPLGLINTYSDISLEISINQRHPVCELLIEWVLNSREREPFSRTKSTAPAASKWHWWARWFSSQTLIGDRQ